MVTSSRALESEFNEQTWQLLLKVILGITDYIISPRDPINNASQQKVEALMMDELWEPLMKTLFELWLRSKSYCIHLWDKLKACYIGWSRHYGVILCWNAVILGLTLRLQHHWLEHTESETVQIVLGITTINIELPCDFLAYAWHKLVFLIEDPSLLSGQSFNAASHGICKSFTAILHLSSMMYFYRVHNMVIY